MKFNETKSQERLINLMLQAGVEWPGKARFAVQNGATGTIAFALGGKPVRDGKYWRSLNGGFLTKGVYDTLKPLPNWHQTIITREQYKARDGWITWHGGECPVDDDLIVEAIFDDGSSSADKAKNWGWDIPEAPIIAYRIHKEQPASEPCESVKACIPDQPTIEQLIAEWKQAQAEQETELNDLKKQQDVYDAARAVTDAAHKRVQDRLAELGWNL